MELGFEMSVKYQGQLSFNLACTRSKLTSPIILYGGCVLECYNFGNWTRTGWHHRST
jgi:hypothetical protein